MENTINATATQTEKPIKELDQKEISGPGIKSSFLWILLFVIFQGIGIITAVIFDGVISGNGITTEPEKLNPIVLIFGILLGSAIVTAMRAKYLCSMLSYKNDKNAWMISIAGIAIIFASSWLYQTYMLPDQKIQPETILFLRAMQSGWMGIGITYLAAAVFAPVLEEILFRGQLQGAIANKLTKMNASNSHIYAILITSAVFALIHVQPLAMPLLFLTGLVMGYIRYLTNSLIMPIAIHIVINSIGITMIYLTGSI